jgi:hypothetical protein
LHHPDPRLGSVAPSLPGLVGETARCRFHSPYIGGHRLGVKRYFQFRQKKVFLKLCKIDVDRLGGKRLYHVHRHHRRKGL